MRDITGQRFGRLVVVEISYKANNKRYWKCICDCGKSCVIRQDQLVTGKTNSCGCIHAEYNARISEKAAAQKQERFEASAPRRKLHDMIAENPRLYNIWLGMKHRCYYSKDKCYRNYGGRGIRICDDWRYSFCSFAEWALSNGYADTLTIDRIDVDGNYAPCNCRWITNREQQLNKRKPPRSATP